MSQKIVKGNEIQVFYQDQTLAYATAHTLTITGNTSDISSKDHGEWGATDVSSLTWEVTGDYFYTDTDYDTLFDLMLYRRPVLIKIAEVKNYDDNGLHDFGGRPSAWVPAVISRSGYAVITNLSVNANTGEKATYSITFTGNGPLSVVDKTITDYFIEVVYRPNQIIEDMKLFNKEYADTINSGWVYNSLTQSTPVQIDISDGRLHNISSLPNNPTFIYYLSSASVPESLFRGSTHIQTVWANGNIKVIQPYAFEDSNIQDFNCDYELVNYMHHCFNNCNLLDHINFNSNRNTNFLNAGRIANNAFSGCVRLTDSYVGEGCSYIQQYGFQECSAMNVVHFGSDLTRIYDDAFTTQSHQTLKEYHFYSGIAPTLGRYPLGNLGYQTIYLHNSTSVQEWLESNSTWAQYATADIRIAN